MWTLYALKLICLYFFNWVQISKFSFKTFRGLVWSGRRNLMRLLALFQPLYHQPPFLGVSPLAGGGKAKVQFKPKTDIGEEGKCLTCKAVDEHSSISPASHRLGRSRKASRVSMPRSKRIWMSLKEIRQEDFYKLRLSVDNLIKSIVYLVDFLVMYIWENSPNSIPEDWMPVFLLSKSRIKEGNWRG